MECCAKGRRHVLKQCQEKWSYWFIPIDLIYTQLQMYKLKPDQKKKVQDFISIANCSEATAMAVLKKYEYNTEHALNAYWENPQLQEKKTVKLDRKKLEQFFNAYKDDPDAIRVSGMVRFCADLGVDPSDIVMLVLSWRLNAATACVYTKAEFMAGMERLEVDSLAALQAKLPQLRKDLDNPAIFEQIYDYAFAFAKEPGPSRVLDLATAIGMWRLLLTGRFPLLDQWCEFLETEFKKAINKDSWHLLLEFVNNVKEDFSNYDPNEAWPYVIDEFVSWVKTRRGEEPS